MGAALQTVLAEMTLKDAASGNAAKIQKAVDGDVKSMKQAEQQAGALNKVLGKLGIGAGAGSQGAGGSVMSNLNERAQGMAQAIGSGSGFHHAISEIHLVGPYLAAAITAMHGSARNYVAGVKLQREQYMATSNAAIAFKRTMDKTTNMLNDSYFHARDTQQALTALRDQGVKPETVDKYAKDIASFTKAQGLGSLQEGIGAMMSGNIKSGRGLTAVQIKQIQAYAPLLRDTMTADIGMRNIARILKKSEAPIANTAEAFETGSKGMIKAAVAIQDTEEATTAYSTGSAEAFSAANSIMRLENDLMNFVGKGAGKAINTAKEKLEKGPESVAGGIIEMVTSGAVKVDSGKKPAGKRIGGGEVNSSGEYLVGEKEPELFRPNSSGRIIPRGNMGRGAAPSITNNFYIQGGNPAQVEQVVMAAMNKAAQTIWRQNTGLPSLG
jgi:hypothetical protein